MKRSKDYYHNRRLIKQLTYDTPEYRPKVKDVRKWFNIMNEQLFGNKLEPFKKINIMYLDDYHALFHYWTKKQNRPPELDLHESFANEKIFVEILTHEMIHLFQYQFKEPLGHGPSFWVWEDNLKLKGLKLHKVV